MRPELLARAFANEPPLTIRCHSDRTSRFCVDCLLQRCGGRKALGRTVKVSQTGCSWSAAHLSCSKDWQTPASASGSFNLASVSDGQRANGPDHACTSVETLRSWRSRAPCCWDPWKPHILPDWRSLRWHCVERCVRHAWLAAQFTCAGLDDRGAAVRTLFRCVTTACFDATCPLESLPTPLQAHD